MNILEIKTLNNTIKYYIIEKRSLKLNNNKPIEYNNFGQNLNLSNCEYMKVREMKILDRDNKKIIALIDDKEVILEDCGLCEFLLKE